MSYDYDVLVIGGGGSAGFTAATTAMKAGAKVGMVEGGRLGGLCILAGCMPSKSLLWSAARRFAGGGPGHGPAMARKNAVVAHLAGNRVAAVKAKQEQGLNLIEGMASFQDEHSLAAGGKTISAAKFIIATGSREFIPPIAGLEQAGYWTSDEFLSAPQLPASLMVLGGGAVALELAQYAARMGSRVSLVQRSATLMSNEAPLVGQTLAQCLAAEGIEVITGTNVSRVAAEGGQKVLYFSHQGQEKTLAADEILMAMGRVPNTRGLNLAALGLAGEKGGLAVDQTMRSAVPHVFAAGDVTGVNMVVNLAIIQGEIAGHNAATGQARQVEDAVLPQAVFTDPQFARVGKNHARAEKEGLDFLEVTQNLTEMGIAQTYPEPPPGFITMRADKKTGRIIGAEIVAPEASLLIHDSAITMQLKGTVHDLANLPYVHPCLSELTNLAAIRLSAKLKR